MDRHIDLSDNAITEFQQTIVIWYDTFSRDLAWRGDSDPYHVLVRELMLQQTGIARVIPKYREFLSRFPTREKHLNTPSPLRCTPHLLTTMETVQVFSVSVG